MHRSKLTTNSVEKSVNGMLAMLVTVSVITDPFKTSKVKV